MNKNIAGFGLLSCLLLILGASPTASREKSKWFKGNTHTHTLWSDGDAAPEYVVDWYKGKGYHFLVLSDHNILAEGEKWVPVKGGKRDLQKHLDQLIKQFGKSSVGVRDKDGKKELRLKTLPELRKRFEEAGRFIMITGEEISDHFKDKPIHHNSLNHDHLIKPPGGDSVREVMKRTMEAVKAEADRIGKPVLVHLNHPNFKWGIEPDDLAHVLEERFFEVYNGHRSVDNYGDAQHKGTEDIWDYVLTLRLGTLGGEVLYGLATDDAHNYHKEQATANPGRGWIMVRSEELTADAITKSMLAGDFYASSGVTLEDISSDTQGITVKIAGQKGVTYTTRFIGTRWDGGQLPKPGEVLQETPGETATYRFTGDELYVRAIIVSSRRHPNGYDPKDFETAWTQPVAVKRPKKE